MNLADLLKNLHYQGFTHIAEINVTLNLTPDGSRKELVESH